ncbi:MAG: molybdopterin molybdenumtransferase MoeA [Porticoccaceae bacterium]|nr:MAG: molybdopterin molybdenumtransferase MoeA [Porticoccaceae bacterium]
MISREEAVARLRHAGAGLHHNVGRLRVALPAALGRVLAEDLVAEFDLPPAPTSAMDGYAFSFADAKRLGFRLPVAQRIPAGAVPRPLEPGTAARIFTGALLPEGADTVALQEHCRFESGVVAIDPGEVVAGANVRPRGEDFCAGRCVLPAGRRLRPQELGLAASLGQAALTVFQPLRVALIATGDELVEPGERLRPGRIYDSNRATLRGLLGSWGVEVFDYGIVRDSRADLAAVLAEAGEEADVIVATGGMSVGEEDHVRSVLAELGSLEFWKIAVKPGKPFAFGQVDGAPFLGLPGNPVSVFVTACLFLRPFLFSMQGAEDWAPRPSREICLGAAPAGSREEFLRGRRTADGVELHPNQGSGVLSAVCAGDGLVRRPAGVALQPGDEVEFYPYSEFY